MVGESDFQTWLSISSISIDSAITAAGNFAMNWRWRVIILILKYTKSEGRRRRRRRGEAIFSGLMVLTKKDRMTKSL